MQTLVLTPTEVFFLPQRLLVPLFQRPYVWSRDAQWVLLWDDIRRQAEQGLKNTGDDAMAEVQGAAQLTDPDGDSEFEPEDPYVVAMAWEITQHYPDSRVNVVSDDFVDRMPRKQSVAFACNELGIECWRSHDFVDYMRGVMANGTSGA